MSKFRLKSKLSTYGLHAQIFYPIPPEEICELYWYVDDIPGDGLGQS